MSLTAFIPTGAPQILPFIGTPGAATVGHALVWSQTPQGFTLSPITVGPDQFSGVLPVSKGGWGTNTGSFTSPGAITLAAGGTNQAIALNPSGNASVQVANNIDIILASDQNNLNKGFSVVKSSGFFQAINGTSNPSLFIPYFFGKSLNAQTAGLSFAGVYASDSANSTEGAVYFQASNAANNGPISSSFYGFVFNNYITTLIEVLGNGDSTFHSTTESTSTTTGAVRINGGLGLAKSLYAAATAGSKVNFANLPTASTGLNPGDLWRDSNGFLRIV